MPTTPYGATKVAIEHFGRVYNKLYGMQVVSLRISEVFTRIGARGNIPHSKRNEKVESVAPGGAHHRSYSTDKNRHWSERQKVELLFEP